MCVSVYFPKFSDYSVLLVESVACLSAHTDYIDKLVLRQCYPSLCVSTASAGLVISS